MFNYELIEVAKLGEFDPKYGQKYWCSIAEDLTPLSFNSKDQDIAEGDSIEAKEKVMRRSSKGTEYWMLRGVSVKHAQQKKVVHTSATQDAPTDVFPTTAGVIEMLSRIEHKLDQLLGLDEELKGPVEEVLDKAYEKAETDWGPADDMDNADADIGAGY